MADPATVVPFGDRLSPWTPARERLLDRMIVVALLLPVPVLLVTLGMTSTALLSALQIAPLWWRRSHPDLCFAAVAVLMAVQLPMTGTPIWGQVALPFAIYSVAAFSTQRRAAIAVGIGLVGAVVGPVDWLTALSLLRFYPGVLFVGACAMLVVAPWALGMLTRTRRAYVAQLIDRGERAEREARQQVELAASDERARIAREMHDVVAHGLSVIVVQADGARYAADQDPTAATRALDTIGRTGRESLTEMRRMLGLLRSDDGATGTRPQPGLVDLDHLLAEAAASGMHLETDLEQPLPEAGAGVGLTVYRVLQEALTNVRKHAGPGPRVRVGVARRAGRHPGHGGRRRSRRERARRREGTRGHRHARTRQRSRRHDRGRPAPGRRLPGGRAGPPRRGAGMIRVLLVDDQAAGPGRLPHARRQPGRHRRWWARPATAARRPPWPRDGRGRRRADGRADAARRRGRPPPDDHRPRRDPPRVIVLTTFDLDEYAFAAITGRRRRRSCSRTPRRPTCSARSARCTAATRWSRRAPRGGCSSTSLPPSRPRRRPRSTG